MSGYPEIIPAHTKVDVTTSSGEVLAANAARSWAILHNISNQDIFLKLGATAVVSEGIIIFDGDCFEISARVGNLFLGAVNAIHGGSGDKALLVTEGT
jgi:hypothetical protein